MESMHKEWLGHPVTVEMFRVLKRHEAALLNYAVDKSESSDVGEDFFRTKLVGVRTVRAVEKLLKETNKFTEKGK